MLYQTVVFLHVIFVFAYLLAQGVEKYDFNYLTG